MLVDYVKAATAANDVWHEGNFLLDQRADAEANARRFGAMAVACEDQLGDLAEHWKNCARIARSRVSYLDGAVRHRRHVYAELEARAEAINVGAGDRTKPRETADTVAV